MVFGVLFFIRPQELAAALGYAPLSAVAIIEVRAVYGGLELALGGAMLHQLYVRKNAANAIYIALISLLGFAGGRTLAVLMDSLSGNHLYYLILEWGLAALMYIALLKLKTEKDHG